MKRALKAFSQEDTIRWFEAAGVPCVLQEDHCWFPKSQDAMDVVHALERGMRGVDLRLRTPVESIKSILETYDFVVVTTGGASRFPFLEGLDLELVPPVPSLFTFTVPDPALRSLMGLVVEAGLSLQGTRFSASGPLLITDWGLSGPATLKLSSYAARHLAENGYQGTLSVQWLPGNEAEVRARLQQTAAENPRKLMANTPLLPGRLWAHLLGKAGLREDLRWGEAGSKALNRLTALLTNDPYPLQGKSRFREEFVTCGGVALSNIDPGTLACKSHPGLYFAGEVLDIDAITGGFNLQAAWSTGYVAAQSIVREIR